ncbi:xylulose kinase [bacterium BMS3Bbin03]|nr:xylulose kinase [bacterium BMS3Bbin03]
MAQFILAHDVGTGGNKAVLVDTTGKIYSTSFEAYSIHYPHPNWAEQNPEDWWEAISKSTRTLLQKSGISPGQVLAMTFSTQMLGIIPMDSDGSVLRPAIIWLDERAEAQAQKLMRKFISPKVFAKIAGAEMCGKDGMPKLLWLKENEPHIYRKMCCFLDVGGYLLYRSTGRMIIDWTGASVFGMNLKKKTWLTGVFRYVGLDPSKFPPLVRSTAVVGTLTPQAAKDLGLLEGTPVVAGAGDAPSAAVGSGSVGEGEGHAYIGTSGWVGVVTTKTPTGKSGVATIHSADPGKAFLFAESEMAGGCLDWMAREVCKDVRLPENSPGIFAYMDSEISGVPPGSGGLIFTPWLYGERAPVSDTRVRSSFINLSANHHREHLLRAVYEGVVYNLRWSLEIVEKKFGFAVPVLRLIGGGAKSGIWMQMLADVTKRKVETVDQPQEAGAVGVALVAAVGLKIYPDFESLKTVVHPAQVFEPDAANDKIYDFMFEMYKEVYTSLKGLYSKMHKESFF